jgi:hypothetical protein
MVLSSQQEAKMSTMISEVYDALLEAGATEDKARRAAEAVAEIHASLLDLSHLVTKDDLKNELEKFATKADLEKFATKADLDIAIAKLETKFASKADLDVAIAKLETKLAYKLLGYGLAQIATVIAAVAGLNFGLVRMLRP